MKYTKPATTHSVQAELLIRRGLQADAGQLVQCLQAISYFRLTTYLFRFRRPGSDNYLPGTSLDSVLRLYTFDQRLRTLLLDAIESIEVFTRTQLAYHFANDFGPFAYSDGRHLPNLHPEKFAEWQQKLRDQLLRSHQSKEDFVIHFVRKYGDQHLQLPIWMQVELMDFGTTVTFFRGVNDDIKKRIAGQIGHSDRVLMSWLLSCNTIRNRCAHHSRVWDWEMGTPVLVPKERKFPEWHAPVMPNNRIGIILTICRYWQNQTAPANQWTSRLLTLFDEYSEVNLTLMGLYPGWQTHPLWKSSS